MDPSQANEIRPIFGISFCLQSPDVWGGGGGRLWEGGNLARLSLVDGRFTIGKVSEEGLVVNSR